MAIGVTGRARKRCCREVKPLCDVSKHPNLRADGIERGTRSLEQDTHFLGGRDG